VPRHRTRQHATHELTCIRTTTDDPAYGEEPTVTEERVVDAEPVEYDSGGTSYIRGSAGERVGRTPTVSGRGWLAEVLEEGDTVRLEPLDSDLPTLSDLEIRGVDIGFNRRARAGSAEIELEQH
jgi:hypothetical protein